MEYWPHSYFSFDLYSSTAWHSIAETICGVLVGEGYDFGIAWFLRASVSIMNLPASFRKGRAPAAIEPNGHRPSG